MSWAKRIARAREAAGLTQQQLADRLNVAQQTVGAWESGQNEPRLAVFAAIAQAAGTTAEWLAFGHRCDAPPASESSGAASDK